ncbi:DUF4041 domain-containing protein [Kribbella sp. CA-293567]|uniref:DUF4041 domain-containing protein n=1 Tax=Kribbella sp. CA-293567 TaxID=3002436 RepID=UPI0022DCF3A0|nr:DUF4041 domain-containing protein [Kribbella sp. CA-293567]WBQ05353.1 DUF4041 domain-containing protein [Kribbella sp. CA-293567]
MKHGRNEQQTGAGMAKPPDWIVNWQYNSPPNWPQPPSGWVPPPDWRPDPAWGPPPANWTFWLPRQTGLAAPVAAAPAPATPQAEVPAAAPQFAPPEPVAAPRGKGSAELSIGLFGARGKARKLAVEVQHLAAQNERLRDQLERHGALSLVEIEERKAELTADLESQKLRLTHELEAEQARRTAVVSALAAEEAAVADRLKALQNQVIVTEDQLILQEVGIYEYTHPLDHSVAYKAELAKLQDQIKAMSRKDGGAVSGSTQMTMNDSLPQGQKMVREFSKLLLRAYNNEADNLVRGMRPYKLSTSTDRLTKAKATIEKLGQSMSIQIGGHYHALRLQEMELTADYLEKVAREKENEREERARLREERQAQQEFQRQRDKLERERTHYLNALAALEAKGDLEAADRMRAEMGEIEKAIEDVDYRAANIRAGYVYVISNLGAFGGRMVKVGMTRRLEPLDRVRELSDASVPFNFDVHAIHFSNDAVGVEAEMHRRLADRRVNRVNLRREFFYATPTEVRDLLAEVAGDLLEFTESAEAFEFHQSVNDSTDEEVPALP